MAVRLGTVADCASAAPNALKVNALTVNHDAATLLRPAATTPSGLFNQTCILNAQGTPQSGVLCVVFRYDCAQSGSDATAVAHALLGPHIEVRLPFVVA